MKKASPADAFFIGNTLSGGELFARGKQFVSPAARRIAPPKECVRCTLYGANYTRGRILGGATLPAPKHPLRMLFSLETPSQAKNCLPVANSSYHPPRDEPRSRRNVWDAFFTERTKSASGSRVVLGPFRLVSATASTADAFPPKFLFCAANRLPAAKVC